MDGVAAQWIGDTDVDAAVAQTREPGRRVETIAVAELNHLVGVEAHAAVQIELNLIPPPPLGRTRDGRTPG